VKTAREKVAEAQQYMEPDVIALHAQSIGAALEAADATCRKLVTAFRSQLVIIRRIQSLQASHRKREARELLAQLAENAELDEFDLPDIDIVLSPEPRPKNG
jgi:hypothetical protein